MPNRPRLLLENVCYHIFARGNNKQQIFFDKQDYEAYLGRLKKYKKEFGFLIYAYCLMPNHIHLVGETKQAQDLSKFMHGLTRSYTAYFNKRYNKVGQLWQGRFKSKAILKNRYLLDCLNYVEMNPIRKKLGRRISEYKWSSYRERVYGTDHADNIISELRI